MSVTNDLLTERLILHPLTTTEAERVIAGEAGPDDQWAPDYPAEGDRRGARRAADGAVYPFTSYEIRRRSDGQAIGGIGFHGAPDETGTAVIGYGLAESARGQGYAGEALRALLAAAYDWDVDRVIGDADLDNLPSQRVMLAAGMAFSHEDAELRHYAVELS